MILELSKDGQNDQYKCTTANSALLGQFCFNS